MLSLNKLVTSDNLQYIYVLLFVYLCCMFLWCFKYFLLRLCVEVCPEDVLSFNLQLCVRNACGITFIFATWLQETPTSVVQSTVWCWDQFFRACMWVCMHILPNSLAYIYHNVDPCQTLTFLCLTVGEKKMHVCTYVLMHCSVRGS